MSEPILTVANMNKKFGSTVALNDVSLTVYPGEIRGLIGENGSGKSTVTSIVAGMQECDSGAMTFQGQSWKPLSMIDALHKGIGMIVQESGTIPGITVAENIFLAESEKYKNKFGLINRKKMNADATRVMKNIGVNDVTGEMLMQKLDFQTRKLVEIAKVVMKEPQILVIDETSTALSHDGREILYDIMNRFRKENKSVIFISHDLDEIMEVCDTLTVLRDGKIIRTFEKAEFEAGAIRASMIGRELQGDYYRSDFQASSQPEVALDVRNLVYEDRLKGISFQVHKGEAWGLVGSNGSGKSTLLKAICGVLKPYKGEIIRNGNISPLLELGAGFDPNLTARENIFLNGTILGHSMEYMRQHFDEIVEFAELENFLDAPIKNFSSGMRARLGFAVATVVDPDILIVDEVLAVGDYAFQQKCLKRMSEMLDGGTTLVFVSHSIDQVKKLCDHAVWINKGTIMQTGDVNTVCDAYMASQTVKASSLQQ